MIGYYDLGRCLPGYDVLGLVLAAEMARIERGDTFVDFQVRPGPREGFLASALPPSSTKDRKAMRDRVALPIMRLLPSCRDIINVSAPPPAGAIVGSVTSLPSMLAAFKAGIRPLQGAPTRTGDYVTITLRESAWWPSRNSNLAEWLRVAEWLKARDINPLFVRDTAKADDELPGFATAPHASVDINARATLYAGARLNLFVNNGPAWLSLAIDAPTLITKMVVFDAGRCVRPDYFASVGLPVGSQIDDARPDQRILWDDDRAEAIIPAVEEMLCG